MEPSVAFRLRNRTSRRINSRKVFEPKHMPPRASWLPLTAFLLAALLLPAAAAGQKQSASVSKYIGPGSCSATACHGGVQPRNVTRVLQNEYSTWAVQD